MKTPILFFPLFPLSFYTCKFFSRIYSIIADVYIKWTYDTKMWAFVLDNSFTSSFRKLQKQWTNQRLCLLIFYLFECLYLFFLSIKILRHYCFPLWMLASMLFSDNGFFYFYFNGILLTLYPFIFLSFFIIILKI